eukprot:768302-Hanusia_phi.AAC.1
MNVRLQSQTGRSTSIHNIPAPFMPHNPSLHHGKAALSSITSVSCANGVKFASGYPLSSRWIYPSLGGSNLLHVTLSPARLRAGYLAVTSAAMMFDPFLKTRPSSGHSSTISGFGDASSCPHSPEHTPSASALSARGMQHTSKSQAKPPQHSCSANLCVLRASMRIVDVAISHQSCILLKHASQSLNQNVFS